MDTVIASEINNQASPELVVRAFFQFIESDDLKGIRSIICESRYKAYKEKRFWFNWLSAWEECVFIEAGDYKKISDAGVVHNIKFQERGVLETKLSCKNRTVVSSIQVTKVNDKSYWDEN